MTIKSNDTKFSESVGAIGLTADPNKIIMCVKFGVAVGDFTTKEVKYILKYPHDQTNLRSNDGTIDPWGNLWIGTMSDFHVGSVEPKGRLYHIDSKTLKVTTMIENCQIANGLGFSKDRKTFYWTDSLTFTVWAFDYNHVTNTLDNKRPFIYTKDVPELSSVSSPEPDGLTMTSEDHFFGCVFSSSRVFHYSNKGSAGGVVGEYSFPAQNITCCTIGGKNNRTLYINSAQINLGDIEKCEGAETKEGDLGGFLFQIELDDSIQGVSKNKWGGSI